MGLEAGMSATRGAPLIVYLSKSERIKEPPELGMASFGRLLPPLVPNQSGLEI